MDRYSSMLGRNASIVDRRSFLASTAALLVAGSTPVRARTVADVLPWRPSAASPPIPVRPGPWMFFTSDEASLVEAIVDRIIPPDERGPGGKDAGCAVFIDRQLAGPYGRSEGQYMRPPFMPGTATQGYQNSDAPGARYRAGLKALDDHLKINFAGKAFRDLAVADQDKTLSGPRDRRHQIRRGRCCTVLRFAAVHHAGGLLLRSDLWRQPRHGRVEADRLPGRALRLSRLGRAP